MNPIRHGYPISHPIALEPLPGRPEIMAVLPDAVMELRREDPDLVLVLDHVDDVLDHLFLVSILRGDKVVFAI